MDFPHSTFPGNYGFTLKPFLFPKMGPEEHCSDEHGGEDKEPQKEESELDTQPHFLVGVHSVAPE